MNEKPSPLIWFSMAFLIARPARTITIIWPARRCCTALRRPSVLRPPGVAPPPSALVPELPAAIDRLVFAATDKDPARRLADANEFLRAIRQVQDELSLSRSAAGQTGEHIVRSTAHPLGLATDGS